MTGFGWCSKPPRQAATLSDAAHNTRWNGENRKRFRRIRLELLKADPHCHYCGTLLSKRTATLDHKEPVSLGGTLRDSNCLLACKRCNNAKGNLSYKEFMRRRAMRGEGQL